MLKLKYIMASEKQQFLGYIYLLAFCAICPVFPVIFHFINSANYEIFAFSWATSATTCILFWWFSNSMMLSYINNYECAIFWAPFFTYIIFLINCFIKLSKFVLIGFSAASGLLMLIFGIIYYLLKYKYSKIRARIVRI
jgi:hypothetical protein